MEQQAVVAGFEGPPIRHLRTRVAKIPLSEPVLLGSTQVTSTAIILLDLETAGGSAGRAYLCAFQPSRIPQLLEILDAIAALVRGRPATPGPLSAMLNSHLGSLLQDQPDLRAAVGLFDMACWDVCGQEAGQPLARLVGNDQPPRPVPAYLTSALGCASPARTRDEALEAARRGFGGYKIQLGHPTLDLDLAAIRAARDALPEGMALMVDYVQSLTKDEAIRRGGRLDKEGLTWIEDPIPYRDLEGHAAIARSLTTPIQLGENFLGPEPMAASIAAGASDLVMIDLPRIGGVTGWLQAAALAAEAGLKMSSHLYPEFAMQLLPTTPTGHWLEYSDLVASLLAERTEIRNGKVVIPDRPGAGIVWNEAALRRYDATP